MVLAARSHRQLFGGPLRRRARAGLAWHGILSEMGMVVVSSSLAVGGIGHALSADAEPAGEGGAALAKAFPRFADDLAWWTEAARTQRARRAPPY